MAIRLLHGKGIGHQPGGQHGGDLQITRLFQHTQIRIVHHGNRLDARCRAGARLGCRIGIIAEFTVAARHHFVQSFDLGHDTLGACAAQLLHRGPVRLQQELRTAGAGDQLAGSIPEHHITGRQLLAQTLQPQPDHGFRYFR